MSRDVHVTNAMRAAVALLCATALWFVVSADQSAAAWVPVQVTLVLDSAVALAEPLAPVQAFVVGRRRDMFRLYQSPPTLHRSLSSPSGAHGHTRESTGAGAGDTMRDSVRLELREQDLDLPPGTGARVGDVRPRTITVRLRRP